jgi:DNA-binding IscR family transcriptional regulator
MQKLVRGGLLRGVRGPRGGYVLAKERRRITIADIYATLDEEKEEDYKGYKATPLGSLIVQPVWDNFDGVLLNHLKQVNLADLCEQATVKQIRKNAEDKTDFTI